jgi:hypothetical protein
MHVVRSLHCVVIEREYGRESIHQSINPSIHPPIHVWRRYIEAEQLRTLQIAESAIDAAEQTDLEKKRTGAVAAAAKVGHTWAE